MSNSTPKSSAARVTEVTRRALLDELQVLGVWWGGRHSDADFLLRLFPLATLPSTDPRYSSMEADIRQHREWNSDWPDDWVFTDARLGLSSSDEALLRFLSEMLHPAVRPDAAESRKLADMFNSHLKHDGWSIVQVSAISGRPIYGPRRLDTVVVSFPEQMSKVDVLSDRYVTELVEKSERRLAANDLEGAVTVSRTMLEAVLFALELRLLGTRSDFQGDLQKLFKHVAKKLRMDSDRDDLDQNFKQVVRGFVQVVNGLAPLRNKMSDGHARERKPAAHHARLLVNAAKTIAMFLIESYEVQLALGLVSPESKT